MNRRILSLLLAALLAVGLLPVGAFAAEGDAAPTAALPDGTSLTVTDTGITTGDGFPVYKTTVPQGTESITVNWEELNTASPHSACTCFSYQYDGTGPLTVPLTGHDTGNEEGWAQALDYVSSEELAKLKSGSDNKMVILTMDNCSADDPKFALLCVELEGVTNSAPTLASGVTLYTVVNAEGDAYSADVTAFFADEDGDALTYYVSVNGGEFTQLENPETYTYAYGEGFVRARLEFKANDGSADSVSNPTVILNDPEYPVVVGANSSAVSTETGKAVQLGIGNLIKHPLSQGIDYFVSIDGGEYKRITLSSRRYTYAPTKAGEHTLRFKAATSTGKESDVYTWTVTATGTDIENHAPTVKSAPEGPGKLGTGCGVTVWKPDLASIFQDPDGDTLTYAYSTDGGNFGEYYPTVGIHADYLKPDGSHTVTIRATDPYGEYAEFTVTIEKTTNHIPTKRTDAPDAVSVFVPVGLTYKVDANLYYADVDAKDQGNLGFCTNRYTAAGSYTAANAGDTKTETVYGFDGTDRSSDGISITYTAIAVDKTDDATTGTAYTIDPAELGVSIPGNYKVRVNGGAEQSFDGTYSYTPKAPGTYTVHIYGDKTSAAAENYVVKLTATGDILEWPTITGFSLSTVTGAAVDGETGSQTLNIKDIQIEQYKELKTSGSNKIAGCITVTVDDDFATKGRSKISIAKNTVQLTASEGADAGNVRIPKTFEKTADYTSEAAYYASKDSVEVYYTVRFIETTHAPGIGNGYADGTTENGVTTFLAGIGSAAPTVTVTAPADGWTAGGNTFTVACEKACVVMVKSGETYTKLTAAVSGDTHSFTATLADGDQIIVRLKGDVNGDGVINNTDAIQARAAALGKTTIDEANAICARVTGGSTVVNTDVIQIGAVSLGKTTFQW